MNELRDRVVELRRIKASELLPHPKNWRRHPDSQRASLQEMFRKIGFAGAELCIELPEEIDYHGEKIGPGVMTVDGHLRAEEAGDNLIPCLITDLSIEEADLMLATFDSIGQMAETDTAQLDELLKQLSGQDAELDTLLDRISSAEIPKPPEAPDEFPEVGEDIETTHKCPKCSYEWSGATK